MERLAKGFRKAGFMRGLLEEIFSEGDFSVFDIEVKSFGFRENFLVDDDFFSFLASCSDFNLIGLNSKPEFDLLINLASLILVSL